MIGLGVACSSGRVLRCGLSAALDLVCVTVRTSGMCDRSLISNDKSEERVRLTFPHHFRLRSSIEFARIYDLNQKASNQHLVIFAAMNELDHSRVGLSVSRRHGNSVRRHRLRRLLKEAFRLQQHEIPAGMDLILIPGRGSKSATQQDFCDAVRQLASKLHDRLSKTQQS